MVPWARFHDLRHSTASFLLRTGGPPLEVARILGAQLGHDHDDHLRPRG
jgi:hypothetical protein